MTEMTLPKPLFDTLHQLEDSDHHQAEYAYPNDLAQAYDFLLSYRGSQATFNAYRRELERLLQWTSLILKKSLAELARDDIENYILFCQNPPHEWINTTKVDRYLLKDGIRKPNPAWRPFVVTLSKAETRIGKEIDIAEYSISQKALQAIFAILGSFFNFLIQHNYLSFNPVAQIRQKSKFIRKQQGKHIIRRLSEVQWAYVIETAEEMAEMKPDKHERILFIMNALYGMYLRVSELAANDRWQPQMGHFQRDRDGNWWFTTVGKGNKERQITVSDAMLNALKRYRTHRQLPTLPTPGEQTVLIPKYRGKGPIESTRQIRTLVQECFDTATTRMEKDGLQEDAEELKAATVHWLRHTGISDDVKIRPREHVRDDAGHSSSAITDKYIDVEMRERHASAKKKKIKPED